MKEDLFAVIDPGSTFSVGVVGRKLPDGRVSPIATHTERSMGCIRHGYIYNIEATATIFKRIIDSLNSRLDEGATIKSIYLGLGCQSMRSHAFTSGMDLGEEGKVITAEHLQTLRQRASNEQYHGLSVVKVADPLYYVDGRPEVNPQGIFCHHLEVCYQVVTVRSSIMKNLHDVVEKYLGLELAGILVTPMAEAEMVLTNEEKTLGCAHVNIGGGCTTLSIYQNRMLAALYVLPFGGQNVTRDLTALRFVEQDAEHLKLKYVSMTLEGIRDKYVSIVSNDHKTERKLKQLDINQYAAARMNEITYNFLNLIEEAGYTEKLGAGMIVTGGGAMLNGYMDQLKSQIGVVRQGFLRKETVDEMNETIRNEKDGRYLTALALLTQAEKPCVKFVEKSLTEMFESASSSPTHTGLDPSLRSDFHTDSDGEEEYWSETDKHFSVFDESDDTEQEVPSTEQRQEAYKKQNEEWEKNRGKITNRSSLFAKGLRKMSDKLSDLFNGDEDDDDNERI